MLVRVSELRQYVYCPRIVYYSTCLPDVRPVTYTMEAGQRAHREVERLIAGYEPSGLAGDIEKELVRLMEREAAPCRAGQRLPPAPRADSPVRWLVCRTT